MSEPYAAAEQKAKNFIAALKASVKVRRYAEAYLDHLVRSEPEPHEFKVGQGQPSFSYLRRRIDRNLNEQDTYCKPLLASTPVFVAFFAQTAWFRQVEPLGDGSDFNSIAVEIGDGLGGVGHRPKQPIELGAHEDWVPRRH